MADQLSRLFAAMADPTRRDIVARLAVGDATVGQLAAPYEETYTTVPLNAYDETGALIAPPNYERKLAGATVHARLAFLSFCIGGANNVLIAEVQQLNVIIPAIRAASNATKRRLAVMDHLMKRRKLAENEN